MIHAVLWMESVGACALLMLWGVTRAFQATQRRWLAVGLAGLSVLFGLGACAIQLIVTGILGSRGMATHLFIYSLMFTVALLGGVGLLLFRGLRRDAAGMRSIKSWPALRMGFGALACGVLYLTTLLTTDSTLQLKLANVRLEAGALAVSIAPARPAERDNAAYVYARVFERLQAQIQTPLHTAYAKSQQHGKTPRWDEPPSPEARAYVASQKMTLELLRKAAAMPDCAFERTYSTPSLSMRLPELGKLRECARLLALEARLRAEEGNLKGALENIQAIEGIAQHISREPILISSLVSIACHGMAVRTLETVLRQHTLSAADLEAWTPDEFFSYQRAYARAMRGERAFGLSAFSEISSADGTQIAQLITTGSSDGEALAMRIGVQYWRVYLMEHDLKGYLTLMEEMEELCNIGYGEAKRRVDALDDARIHQSGIVSVLLLPAISRTYQTFYNAEGEARLARLARAVCAYRAKHNAFPAELGVLVPEFIDEIPLDPFVNQPLRMTVHPGGVTLYSLGTDLRDDGGKPAANQPTENDLVLRIGNVPEDRTSGTGGPVKLPPPPEKGAL